MSQSNEKKSWLNRLFGKKEATETDSNMPSSIDQELHEDEKSHDVIEESAPNDSSLDSEFPAEDTAQQKTVETLDDTHEPIVITDLLKEEPLHSESTSSNELISNNDEPIEIANPVEPLEIEIIESEEISAPLIETEAEKKGLFSRLKTQLSKTSEGLTSGFADLFLGKKSIDEDILEALETRLLMADVGINATQKMIDHLSSEVSRKSLSNADELFQALRNQMKQLLTPVEKPLIIDETKSPFVILMIGVNGVGKTTTIGKLAKQFQAQGKSVMLAAGDTFRAAAVDQLKVWGMRNNITVISQKEGSDPASVIFDAVESAKSKKVDILIADTAGRLHTQAGLMQELAKINRVIKKVDENAPHETMLVVDASTGQNALNQAVQFNEIAPISGISFTKLDGTAKGGIIFAIAEKLNIPIRYIGVGEGIDDLRTFNADEFIDALIDDQKKS